MKPANVRQCSYLTDSPSGTHRFKLERKELDIPILEDSLLKYRKYKASGKAIITLNGRDIYLGNFGTVASKRKYEQVANAGRQIRCTVNRTCEC